MPDLETLTAKKTAFLKSAYDAAERLADEVRPAFVSLLEETGKILGVKLDLEKAQIRQPTFPDVEGFRPTLRATFKIIKDGAEVGRFEVSKDHFPGLSIRAYWEKKRKEQASYYADDIGASLTYRHAEALASGKLNFLRDGVVPKPAPKTPDVPAKKRRGFFAFLLAPRLR